MAKPASTDCTSPDAQMTYGGIGPRLALSCLPYIALSAVVMRKYPEFLRPGSFDSPLGRKVARVAGSLWLGIGIVFWAVSGVYFLKNFKQGELMTKGPFALTRNPIYASMILFVVPGLGLLSRSGLVLSDALVLYVGFKLSIHGETNVLRRNFGEEYEEYARNVNELFPFPRFLLKTQRQGQTLLLDSSGRPTARQ